jgi:opacity protein-like surface antigen
LGAVLALALSSGRAAADVKEWTVGVAPTYAISYVDERNPSGGGASLDLGFGISEALSLHASGFVSWHPTDKTKTNAAGTIGVFGAMVGLTYTIDIIRIVPYFDLGIGVLGLRGDAGFGSSPAANRVAASSTAFGVEVGFGAEYLINRHVAVGVVARYHAFVTDITRIPVYLYVGPRLSFHFGG